MLVANLLHPLDDLAFEGFRDGDVCHGRGGRGAVPVFFARCEPNDIARAEVLDRTPFPLRTTGPRHDKKCLPERVGVPGCARARLEGDRSATNAGRSRSGERRVNSHRASEIVGRAFGRGLGSVALDIQCRTLSV